DRTRWPCAVVEMLLPMALVTACGAEPRDTAYVLAAAKARAGGVVLVVDGVPESAVLPIAIEQEAEGWVRGPSVRSRLRTNVPRAGEVLVLRDESGETETRVIGEEACDHKLAINASEDAARELAGALGAELINDRETVHIVAPDIFERVAYTTAPE